MLDRQSRPTPRAASWSHLIGPRSDARGDLRRGGTTARGGVRRSSPERRREVHAGRPFALIENVVTRREHRKRGYGRQLVKHAIEAARQQGCYRVTLMTGSRREETLRFYESAGLRRDTKTAFEARFA